LKLRVAAVLLLPCGLVHAEPRITQNDFGGTGLLQTPTARMAPAGELSVNANRTEPYSRYSVSLQPLDWLEGSFRYTAITNRPYGSGGAERQPELQGQGGRRQSPAVAGKPLGAGSRAGLPRHWRYGSVLQRIFRRQQTL
jgi:hypothetical protein